MKQYKPGETRQNIIHWATWQGWHDGAEHALCSYDNYTKSTKGYDWMWFETDVTKVLWLLWCGLFIFERVQGSQGSVCENWEGFARVSVSGRGDSAITGPAPISHFMIFFLTIFYHFFYTYAYSMFLTGWRTTSFGPNLWVFCFQQCVFTQPCGDEAVTKWKQHDE